MTVENFYASASEAMIILFTFISVLMLIMVIFNSVSAFSALAKMVMFKDSQLDVLKNLIDLIKYIVCTYMFYKSLTYMDMDAEAVQAIINTLVGATSLMLLLIPVVYKASKAKKAEPCESVEEISE